MRRAGLSKNSQKSSFPRKRESRGSYYNSTYNIHNAVCVMIYSIHRASCKSQKCFKLSF